MTDPTPSAPSTPAGLTEIVCVLDRSGSMERVRADAVGGFNAFLAAQQALPGEARLTLVLFDHAYDVVLDGVPVANVPPLTDATYVPRGSTALLDAVGQTVQTVHGRIAGLPEGERPGAVLVCILTDGQENCSQEYTREAVRALVERRQADGWAFQFLGAGPDAFAEAGGIGIARADAAQFSADSAGTAFAFALVSDRAASVRSRSEPVRPRGHS